MSTFYIEFCVTYVIDSYWINIDKKNLKLIASRYHDKDFSTEGGNKQSSGLASSCLVREATTLAKDGRQKGSYKKHAE